MWIVNSVIDKLFEVIFLPFRSLSPWVGMILISLLTGFLMLLIYRHTSNQAGIRAVKDKIKAHLLEIRLYKDNMSVSLRAEGNIVLANFRYIGYALKPLLVMIVPVLLILIQLNFWFAYKSLEPGETAILKVTLDPGKNPPDYDATISPSPAFEVETPALRIDEDNTINWRLRVKEKGVHSIQLTLGALTVSKDIAVGQKPLSRLSPLRVKRNVFEELLYPTEKPLPGGTPVKSIEVTYPSKSLSLFGWHIHWLIVFFALSIILGFAFKGVFKVEI